MAEQRHILVAADLSEAGLWGLRRAALLATPQGIKITVLHVVPPAQSRDEAEARSNKLAALVDEVLKLRRGPKIDCQFKVIRGSGAEAITAAIKQIGIHLAIFGPHQFDLVRSIFFDRTAEQVVQEADCPVLMVRSEASESYRHVLLATEASPASHAAARTVFDLCPDASVVTLHVADTPFRILTSDTLQLESAVLAEGRKKLSRWLGALGGSTNSIEPLVLLGDAPSAIVDAARMREADLIAIGSRTTSQIVRMLIGGVARRVMREAPCDVLVVPPMEE